MPKKKIDREKLRQWIRKERDTALLVFLDRAVDLLPATRLPALMKDFIGLRQVLDDGSPPADLLDQVQEFHRASLAGEFYEDYVVSWRNSNRMPRATCVWLAEFARLVDLCVEAVKAEDLDEAGPAFELFFDLVRHLDQGEIIVFFPDDEGSEQIPVVWDDVLPFWFRCIAASTEPEEYARKVKETVDWLGSWHRDELVQAAVEAAGEERGKAVLAESKP